MNVTHYTEAGPRPAGTVMTVEFELDGQRFVGINGGPQFTFDEAVSFQIDCETRTKSTTTGNGCPRAARKGRAAGSRTGTGCPGRSCRRGMDELFADPDPQRAERAMRAMLGMRKLDIAALRSAADGAVV